MHNKTIIYLAIILGGVAFHTAAVAQDEKPAIYEEVMDGFSPPQAGPPPSATETAAMQSVAGAKPKIYQGVMDDAPMPEGGTPPGEATAMQPVDGNKPEIYKEVMDGAPSTPTADTTTPAEEGK